VIGEIERGEIDIVRGSVTLMPVCNPTAYREQRRMGDCNFNCRLMPTAKPQDQEDRLGRVLCPLLAEHEVPVDLHSFGRPGRPTVMRDPADNDGALEPFRHAAAEALADHDEALAQHHGPLDAECRAQAHHVVGQRVEHDLGQRPLAAATVAAVVHAEHLRQVGQLCPNCGLSLLRS
jgi:predicted deacylase